VSPVFVGIVSTDGQIGFSFSLRGRMRMSESVSIGLFYRQQLAFAAISLLWIEGAQLLLLPSKP
jgi:hypothetical protein